MISASRPRQLAIVLVSITLAVAYCCLRPTPIGALQGVGPPEGWTAAYPIVHSPGEVAISSPNLTADTMGNLHLLYLNRPEGAKETAINYMMWNGIDWSPPVDALLDPESQHMVYLQSTLDNSGVMHVVWFGYALRYASAPVSQASSPRAWSLPKTIASSQGNPAIVAGSDQGLYVAYADNNGTIAVLRSKDGGATWSAPMVVAQVSTPQTLANDLYITQDELGRLHIGWTEYELPEGWPPQATFYTQSTDSGQSWATPQLVAEANYGQMGIGIDRNNGVHLVWRSTIGGDGTFHKWSDDGGLTWSEPDRSADRGGFSGSPTFATDTLGRLHYVLGRTYYTMWEAGQLSPYQDLRTHSIAASISYGEAAVLDIVNGNHVHVVYITDFNYIWHTHKIMAIEAQPTRTYSPDKVNPSEPIVSTPTATLALEPEELVEQNEGREVRSSMLPQAMVGAIVPSLLLIVLVILMKLQRR